MILMLLVFPYDTPVALKQARNWDGLTLIMTRMYKKDQVNILPYFLENYLKLIGFDPR